MRCHGWFFLRNIFFVLIFDLSFSDFSICYAQKKISNSCYIYKRFNAIDSSAETYTGSPRNRIIRYYTLTLKMTTAQVVETSVTNNSLSEDCHPGDHTKQKTTLLNLTAFLTRHTWFWAPALWYSCPVKRPNPLALLSADSVSREYGISRLLVEQRRKKCRLFLGQLLTNVPDICQVVWKAPGRITGAEEL